ncbi:serine/threonine-protein phosphatase 7 long form homolog [Quercus suber]|uniref:serine/threonine-protein phosphatase 7 long form homolog n=1 Tax=Quercus suber TaxID=58331 RepID=UPI0032DE9EDA
MIACMSDMQQMRNVDPIPTVVPGVLKCRCRSCELPRHGLDPRIAHYITEAGFEGLFKVPNLEADHVLITTLVKRWCPEMHTFHLLHGEIGITLQDIEVMLRVPVDGLLVIGSVKMDWLGLCHDLLGHRPPDLVPHPHENRSILTGVRIRVSWLKPRFKAPLVANATDEVVQQHACYHILVWLGSILFMDKSINQVLVMPLQFLNPISNAKRYSRGSGALAWLYRHLCKASEMKAMQIGGALMLVQL